MKPISWGTHGWSKNDCKAAPEYMNPKGIVVYHKAAATGFKMTLDNDDKPKGKQ